MKSIIKFFVCGIFFFSFSSAFSQQLGLSTQILSYPDTSFLGFTDSITVKVRNLDTAAYSGYINIYYTTDTVTFSPVLFCTIQNFILPGFDSVQTSCTINFDSTYFNNGDNIVVVWSSGNAKAPADSVWVNIYLDSTGAGVHDINLSSAFTIYPTLTKDFINVEFTRKNFPKKLFIEDVSGRIIKVVSPSPDNRNQIKINTSELNSGIYFLDILLPDKQRVVSKFVKAD